MLKTPENSIFRHFLVSRDLGSNCHIIYCVTTKDVWKNIWFFGCLYKLTCCRSKIIPHDSPMIRVSEVKTWWKNDENREFLRFWRFWPIWQAIFHQKWPKPNINLWSPNFFLVSNTLSRNNIRSSETKFQLQPCMLSPIESTQ